MAFNNVISRSDIAALIPEQVSNDLLTNITETSAVMQLGKRLANMSTNQTRMPVMSALATAYFVDGDTGLKQTSEVNWANKYIDAEELAVIVPIPEAVLSDTAYDVWGQIRPSIAEAFGRAIDASVLYGTNIPSSWTTNLGGAGIVAGATTQSTVVSAAAYTDLYEAILGEKADGTKSLYGKLEAYGYMATGNISPMLMRGKLRNVRDQDGGLIFKPSMQAAGQYVLDGAPMLFPRNGAISDTYWLISGQWDKLVYAMRQDITYKVLDQAVIQDNSGAIIYNLAQQDMVALRAVMRLGFALPHTVTRMDSGAGFPFAVLTA